MRATRCNKQDEHHYWVEINGSIFDLTADQFNNADLPIFGAKIDNPHLGFREFEREFISYYSFFYIQNCLDIERVNKIRAEIIRQIEQAICITTRSPAT